jgi:hypothetical protein
LIASELGRGLREIYSRFFQGRVNDIVMSETKEIRDRWLTIWLNEDEYAALDGSSKDSTSNALSKYARDILLRRHVKTAGRDLTLIEPIPNFFLKHRVSV